MKNDMSADEREGLPGRTHWVSDALFSILQGMDRYITRRLGVDWARNPADPKENFSDKWAEHVETPDGPDRGCAG